MPSPIVYTDIPQYNTQADVCDKLELLLRTSDRFRDFLEYAFDVAGNVSTEFAEDIAKAVGPLIGVPVGAIIWRPVTAVPDGYVIANGQSLLRTDYADLFAVYGTAHGSDSATTFKVPNLYDRFLIGGGSTYVVGSTGGEALHVLTPDEGASHDHVHAFGKDISGANDDVRLLKASAATIASQSTVRVSGDNSNVEFTAITDCDLITAAPDGQTGDADGHNNIPPYMAGLWLVKT